MISVKIPKNQNRMALFERAKAKAKRSGARLTGCVASGEFSAKGITGTYRTQEDFLEIDISKKPFYVSENMIETLLKTFFEA